MRVAVFKVLYLGTYIQVIVNTNVGFGVLGYHISVYWENDMSLSMWEGLCFFVWTVAARNHFQ